MTENKSKTKSTPARTQEKKSATKDKAPSKSRAMAKGIAPPKPAAGEEATRLIDEQIQSLGDWSGKILEAIPKNPGGATSQSKSPNKNKPSKAKAKSKVVNPKADKAQKLPKVVLLQGGNPQIAKGEGDAPVQAYIAALESWKREIAMQLDSLIQQKVPQVRKAVKWNSPFYGVDGQGWFLSFHVFTRYLKVTFFKGDSLRPIPPGGTPRSKEARWLDIHEGDPINTEQLTTWIKQAAAMPGWMT